MSSDSLEKVNNICKMPELIPPKSLTVHMVDLFKRINIQFATLFNIFLNYIITGAQEPSDEEHNQPVDPEPGCG